MANMLAYSDGDSASTYLTRICCSVCTFVTANYLFGVICLLMVLSGIAGIIASDSSLAALPPEAYIGIFTLGVLSALIVCCGACGQRLRIECFFLLYIFALVMLIIAETVAFSFLFLYEVDVINFKNLDQGAIINGDDVLINSLTALAEDNADGWVKLQDSWDCCGVTFETGLEAVLNEDDLNIDPVTETGARCTVDDDDVANDAFFAALRDNDARNIDNFDEFGNFIEARIDPIIGFNENFYCVVLISEQMSGTILIVTSFVVALSMFLQFTSLIAASRMYWVPEFLGGWQFDDEELELVAKRKGIEFPKDQPTGGNRVLSTLRAGTQRLSFRLRNAYTADPDIPKSAGILNRLSVRRGAGSFRGVGEDGTYTPTQPSGPPGRQNMFNRISQRLFNIGGGKSVIDLTASEKANGMASPPPQPPQPPNPPPSSRRNRMSQRVVQSFNSIGSAFRRQPKAPLPPNPPAQSSVGFGMPDPANNTAPPSFSSAPPGHPPSVASSQRGTEY